jgi:hypothetical protein
LDLVIELDREFHWDEKALHVNRVEICGIFAADQVPGLVLRLNHLCVEMTDGFGNNLGQVLLEELVMRPA